MKSFWARLAPWAVAAMLACTALWLGRLIVALRAENQSLRTERMLAEISFKLGQSQLAERTLLAENMINRLSSSLRHAEDLARLKVSVLAGGAGLPPAVRAIVFWDPARQAGLLTLENFPANDSQQEYQLWLIDPAQPLPIAAGTFQVDASGRLAFAFKSGQPPVSTAVVFAVSVAPKGAPPAVPGPFVLHSP